GTPTSVGEGGPIVYDEDDSRNIVHRGCSRSGSTSVNDTWVLTNANGLSGTPAWDQLNPQGSLPSARRFVVSGASSSADRLIIATGEDGSGDIDEVWTLSNPFGTFGTSVQPPTADAGGPYSVNEGSSIQLAGSGTDPN